MEVFTLGGREFKLIKLDAMKQFHVARRLGPILADLLPSMKGVMKLVKKGSVPTVESLTAEMSSRPESEQLESAAEFLSPIMDGLSKLSDEESEMVLRTLLSGVEMKQSAGNWLRISNGTLFAVQDLDLPVMLNLAGRSFMHNLAGFFASLPQK